MYEKQGQVDVFLNEKKPRLTNQQIMLISSFYALSQEREYNDSPRKIKRCDVTYYVTENGCMGYASDIFMFLINDIDSHYMKEENEKIELQRKRDKNK